MILWDSNVLDQQMGSLSNKRIVLGVTGGIAAYKSAELLRRLIEMGAEIRVVMTPAAMEFVRPLTFQALSGNPVCSALVDYDAEAGMGHIELAKWADLLREQANIFRGVEYRQAQKSKSLGHQLQ